MKAGGKKRLSPSQAWLLKLPSTKKQKTKKKKKTVPVETYKEYIFNMHKESQELQNNK